MRGNNVVFIGLPGCGKSTIGRIIAKKFGMRFLDTDEELARREGCSAHDLFAEGEQTFRDAETRTLQSLLAFDGFIIAAGGGVVVRPCNIPLLHRLGIVVYLDRYPDQILATANLNGRAQLAGRRREKLFQLYTARKSLYESSCDIRVVSPNSLEDSVRQVIRALSHSGRSFQALVPQTC